MASTINAKNTSSGLVLTPDATGQLELQTADTTRMTIDSSGNVGIGTSSPGYKLVVNGEASISNGTEQVLISGTSGAIEITRTAGNPFIDFKSAIAEDFDCRIQQNNNGLAFSTGGNGTASERMRIDSSGNLLVGTTSTSGNAKMTVSFAGGSSSSRGLVMVSGSTSSTAMIGFQNPNGYAQGEIITSGTSTSYNTSSDYRLKENITSMTGALEKVALLNPVTYTWKEDGSDGQGFIAHELQAVVPDCVTGEKDAVDSEGNPVYQGIDTSFLVATLTAAIKELKAELDTVKAELAELKGAA